MPRPLASMSGPYRIMSSAATSTVMTAATAAATLFATSNAPLPSSLNQSLIVGLVLLELLVELVALDQPPTGPFPAFASRTSRGKSSANFWPWSTSGRMNA